MVDRTCVTGSLARGTFAAGCEATGLVLFLNLDLQFGPYEVPQALEALASTMQSGLALDGWRFDLQVANAECRGGLWAVLHCSPLPTPELEPPSMGTGRGTAEDREQQQSGPAARAHSAGSTALQLFLAENLTKTVAPVGLQVQAGGEEVCAAAGSAADGASDPRVGAGGDPAALCPVSEVKALQQQQNLVAAAETRARREACHHAGHGGSAAAAAASAPSWAARLGCGVAEARRIFWLRQPEAALRAARGAHQEWARAVEAEVGQLPQKVGGPAAAAGSEATEPGGEDGVGWEALWSDEVMHLLDVLALHAHRENHAASQPGLAAATTGAGEGPEAHPPGAAQGAQPCGLADSDPRVGRIFEILAADFSGGVASGVKVALDGGMLFEPCSIDEASASAGKEGKRSGVRQETERRPVVVRDPCFPELDLYAAACEVLGQNQGPSAGQQRLRRLAEAARSHAVRV